MPIFANTLPRRDATQLTRQCLAFSHAGRFASEGDQGVCKAKGRSLGVERVDETHARIPAV